MHCGSGTYDNYVDENPFNPPNATVTPQHILAAVKAYTPAVSKAPTTNSVSNTSPMTNNSETVSKIRNLGLHAQLVLLTILLGSKWLEVGLSYLHHAMHLRKNLRLVH
jgi:cell division control protein 6